MLGRVGFRAADFPGSPTPGPLSRSPVKESPEQSSKSGRGSCFGASLPSPPTPWGYTTPGLATTHRDDRRVTTERLLCEKISGKGTDGRVELARLLKRLGDGDVLMGFAEFDRELINARTGEGRARANEALQRLANGETQADLARSYGVGVATINRLAASSPFSGAVAA